MRASFYWLIVTAIAVLAARASDMDGEGVHAFLGDASQMDVLPVPEPSRAVLLGIGIMAVGYTYRRAWLNLKRNN